MSDERQFEIDLPPELIAGSYADFANVWHTPTVFIMDFLTLAKPPTEVVDAETGERRTIVPARTWTSAIRPSKGAGRWRAGAASTIASTGAS